jgi:hypothetical protein
VGISSATAPVILSVGQVWCPSAGRYIERRVQVKTKGEGFFMKGLVANLQIAFSGNFGSDSFDSSDPAYSTLGRYDASKHKDNGDVATNYSDEDAIKLSGSVTLHGHVATGPEGTVTMSGGAIGSTSYVDSGGKGIEEGYYAKDMNVDFPAVTAPFKTAPAPTAGIVGGVTYDYVLTAGNWQLSKLALSSGGKMLVTGNATLLVDKDVKLSGNAYIQINPGANLQMYVAAGSVGISGNSIMNLTGNAANFGLWGLPTLQNVSFSGDGLFTGTIYAPQAKLAMSGGSDAGMDFIGAAVVKQAAGSGTRKFHYDEALGNSAKNLVISSWNEL